MYMLNLVESKKRRNAFNAMMLAGFLAFVGGCATIEGAGKDIQSAGEALEEGAEEASN
jgi:predicted small secreted protein